MYNLNDVLEQENRIAKMISEVKDAIRFDLTGSKIPQMNPVEAMMVTITLAQFERGIFEPEYYMPEVQAQYVDDALKNVTTASDFVKKVREMVDKKGVTIGWYFHRLNSNTIRILNKYLGESEAAK